MAEILLFPTERLVGAAPRTQLRPSEVEGLAVEAGADEWPEEDALDDTSLAEQAHAMHVGRGGRRRHPRRGHLPLLWWIASAR